MTRSHRLLTLEEELALGRRIQAGDKAALNELVEHNVGLVRKIARKVYADDPAMEYDDLVQIGMLGLMHAASKYEPERGFKFSTYAVWWIKQRIFRAMLTSGPIPRSANPDYKPVLPASIRAQAIRQAPIVRLDAPLRDRRGDESDATFGDLIASPGPSVEEQVFSSIETERLIGKLNLNERGEAIVRAYLSGIPRHEAQEMHGVSRSWLYTTLETRRERLMNENPFVKTCKAEGCYKPCYKKMPFCHAHAQEYWREKAAEQRQANGATPRQARQSRPQPQQQSHEAPPAEHLPVVEAPVISEPDHHCADNCDTCIYREAFDLIAERYPDAAELIAAMQTLKRWRKS